MATVDKPEHGSEAWLAIRKQDQYGRIRFGASEAPTLMGVNPYATIADLALDKWTPAEVTTPNDAMIRGNVLEPALVDYASTLLGQPVTTPDEMHYLGRLIATLDGITADGKVIVECKTTTSYSSDDEVPPAYYWQAIAQLAVCPAADYVLVVVLDKRMRLGTWRVNRDADDINRLFDRADYVGEYLDRKEMPPDADITERHVIAMHPNPAGVLELGSAGVALVVIWQAAKEARELAEREEQDARNMLTAFLGANETGAVDGIPVVTYKQRKGSTTVDWKAVARDHKDLLDKYRKQGAPTRVLRYTMGKDGE